MNNFIENFLKRDSDRFNNKTFGIEDYKKIIRTQKIFNDHGELQFLPKEFHLFVDLYIEHPDRHIKINTYNEYFNQYLQNMLLPIEYEIRYILFHREIYDKITPIKIQMIYIQDTNKFTILKDFNIKDNLPNEYGEYDFETALMVFLKN